MNEGIKISQLGFDASTTGDRNLLMSSGWPLLKIEKTGTINLNGSVDTDIYTHNLGYPPFFLIEVYDTNKTYMVGPRQRTAEPRYYVTNTKLAIQGAGDGSLPNFNIRYYICRLPLDQPFQAPTYSLSDDSSAQRDNNIGIKVLKSGKDSSSTDLRDYTLHSGTRSPQVHSVTTGPLKQVGSFDYELTWKNDLGYNPLYFAFQRNDSQQNVLGVTIPPGQWFGPINISTWNPNSTAVQDLTAFDVGTGYASIVIFKDPFLIAGAQQVAV